MDVSPNDAEESLAAIHDVTRRARHSIASSGVHIFLVITGFVWFVGFLATQFLSGDLVAYIWAGASVAGSGAAVLLGIRMGRSQAKRVRNPELAASARRGALFWALLVAYAVAAIAVARPTDGRQITMFVVLFTMIGQSAMGLLLSHASVWWALPIVALALVGYFLFPHLFYGWMAVLVGGAMIALGLYIRLRW